MSRSHEIAIGIMLAGVLTACGSPSDVATRRVPAAGEAGSAPVDNKAPTSASSAPTSAATVAVDLDATTSTVAVGDPESCAFTENTVRSLVAVASAHDVTPAEQPASTPHVFKSVKLTVESLVWSTKIPELANRTGLDAIMSGAESITAVVAASSPDADATLESLRKALEDPAAVVVLGTSGLDLVEGLRVYAWGAPGALIWADPACSSTYDRSLTAVASLLATRVQLDALEQLADEVQESAAGGQPPGRLEFAASLVSTPPTLSPDAEWWAEDTSTRSLALTAVPPEVKPRVKLVGLHISVGKEVPPTAALYFRCDLGLEYAVQVSAVGAAIPLYACRESDTRVELDGKLLGAIAADQLDEAVGTQLVIMDDGSLQVHPLRPGELEDLLGLTSDGLAQLRASLTG